MNIAQLILDYLKALQWPLVVIGALVILRKSLPELIGRIESLKFGGSEFRFSAAGRAIEAVVALPDERTTSEEQPSTEDLLPGVYRFTPRSSASKIFRNLRVSLYHGITQANAVYGLPLVEDGRVVLEPPKGLLRDAPRWGDLAAMLRNLGKNSGEKGWDQLAEAVEAMEPFSQQPLPPRIMSATAALLAQRTSAAIADLVKDAIAAQPDTDQVALP
jgi:hypothetical protein